MSNGLGVIAFARREGLILTPPQRTLVKLLVGEPLSKDFEPDFYRETVSGPLLACSEWQFWQGPCRGIQSGVLVLGRRSGKTTILDLLKRYLQWQDVYQTLRGGQCWKLTKDHSLGLIREGSQDLHVTLPADTELLVSGFDTQRVTLESQHGTLVTIPVERLSAVATHWDQETGSPVKETRRPVKGFTLDPETLPRESGWKRLSSFRHTGFPPNTLYLLDEANLGPESVSRLVQRVVGSVVITATAGKRSQWDWGMSCIQLPSWVVRMDLDWGQAHRGVHPYTWDVEFGAQFIDKRSVELPEGAWSALDEAARAAGKSQDVFLYDLIQAACAKP